MELLHDVHERLGPVEAARLAKDLEPYHLFFLEDLLRPEYKESFRLVREHSTTPLAMGELFNTLWDCVDLIKEQLIDFIRCDLGHIGGITNARKVAALAEAFQVKTAWHGPGDIGPPTHAANVHVDISIPNFGVQEMVFFPEVTQGSHSRRAGIQRRLHDGSRNARPGDRRERRIGQEISLSARLSAHRAAQGWERAGLVGGFV